MSPMRISVVPMARGHSSRVVYGAAFVIENKLKPGYSRFAPPPRPEYILKIKFRIPKVPISYIWNLLKYESGYVAGIYRTISLYRFGVCCVFVLSTSGTVTQNCTYIQNPGYPSSYAGSGLTYTVNKCSSGIRQRRNEFGLG